MKKKLLNGFVRVVCGTLFSLLILSIVQAKPVITIGQSTPTLTLTVSNAMVVDSAQVASVVTSATEGRGGAINFSISSGGGSATVDPNSGLITAIGAGIVTLTASSAGDTDYFGSSVSQDITIAQATPTLTFTSSNTLPVDGMLTATVVTTATNGRGGAITFAITSGGSGSATVDAASGLITAISAGNVTLIANSAGDSDYRSASASQDLSISAITPSLSIISSNMMNVDGALAIAVTTTASHDIGTLNYSMENGVGAAIANQNGLINAFSAGTVTLTVTSAGNADYNPTSATQLITIGQNTPTLTVTSADSLSLGDSLTVAVVTTATFGRGGSMNFAITGGSGSATVDPNTGLLIGIGAGTVTLVANSTGDNDYNAAIITQELTILAITPTLTITSANSLSIDGTLTATVVTTAPSGRGGAISFAITGGSGSATVDASSGLITGISAGNVTLIASSAGDSDYNPASTSQNLNISSITPVLTITSADSLSVDGTLTATVVTTATGGRGGSISFAVTGGSGSATVDATSGLITGISAGNVTLVASSAGNSDYAPSTTSQLLTISQITPVLTITSADNLSVDGTLTATVVTTATGGRGGAISFAITGGSGSATVDATSGLIIGISAGNVTLAASSAGDSDYAPATTSQALTILMTTPVLTITSADNLSVDGTLTATVVTTATGGRGGAISFAIAGGSGSATVDATSGLITGISAGNVTLVASSAGDSDYAPATTSQALTILMTTPALTITSGDSLNVDGTLTATVVTTATGGRGGSISFAIIGGSGSATVDASSGLITGISAGNVTLVASSAGDSDYNPATTSQNLNISSITPVLTITSADSLNVDGTLTATVVTTATNGRGGSISFAITGGSGSATVDATSGLITGISAGNVTLVASSAGDSDYNPASTSQNLNILSITPVLTITSGDSLNVDGTLTATVVTTATGGRGGSISFAVTGGSGSATVDASSGLITGISAGNVTLVASSAGDSDYAPASTSQSLTILMTTPVLTITSGDSLNVDGTLTATVVTTATNGRGGSISFAITSGSGSATVDASSGLITGVSAGNVTLVVSSAGDSDYAPASTSQSLTILMTTPVLTITSGDSLNVDGTLTATVVTTATNGRGGSISFAITGGSGSATVDATSGLITGISAGNVTLVANSAGDSDYNPASTSQNLNILSITPVLTITSGDSLNVDGTLTATVVTTATGGRGGSISFAVTGGSGSATVDASSGLITGISAGNVTLVASSAGDSDYAPASTSQSLTILMTTPVLTITSGDSLNVDGTLTATVVTTATNGRGGSISFAITSGSGSATVDASSGLITGVSAGNVTLVVSSAGDSDYAPASTSQNLNISSITPVLTITSADSLSVDGTLTATVVTTATNGRGGAISFAIIGGSGSATVDASSGLITGISAGNVTLVASSAGDSDYAPASTSQNLNISSITPVLTITSADSLSVDGTLTATVVTTATNGRGGAISFAIIGGSGSATVDASSGLITGISAGNVTLVASSAGDSDYNPASTSQNLNISSITPVLTITSADSLNVDGTLTATVVTTATNGRGGSISFAITGGSGSATVDATSGLITGISAGNVTLVANSAGDNDYSPASTSQLLTISQSTPVLTITSADSLSVDGMLTATVVTTATNGRGGSITFAIAGGSGSATVDASSGLITGISAGNVTLVASSAGDSDYVPSTTSQALTILMTTPVLTITSADNLSVDGTLTATVVTTATGGRGGAISFAITGGSGSATVDATSGLIAGISAGNVTLVASSAGDSDYAPASTSQLLTISQSTPVLTITSGDSLNVDGTLTATVVTTATSGRGGSISFAITGGSGSATVDATSGLITGISAGNVTLVASSEGDSDYNSATTSQNLNISSITPVLTITSADSLNVDGTLTATVVTTATGGRGGSISFAITSGSGSATVDATSGLITGISAGNVTLVANSAGDNDYSPASTSQLLTISQSTPTLTITSGDSLSVDGMLTATVVTTATNGRGGAITFAIAGGSGSATVDSSSGLITGISAGNVTLVASSAGDSDYAPASTSQLLTISQSTPVLTITSGDSLNVDGTLTATVVTTATGGRGGAISFAITAGSGSATVDASSGLITGISAGNVTLVASSAGDSDYAPASTSQSLTILMTIPALTITSGDSLNVDGTLTATVVTTATGGRGGAISFAITGGSGSATVDASSGLITGISAGNVTLIASSAGDSDYNPATTSQNLNISSITPVLTITSADSLSVDGALTATVVTTATNGRGGAITFAIAGGSGSATVDASSGLITGISAGNVTLVASSAGDSDYAPATTSQALTILMATPILTITSADSLSFDGMLTATVVTTATNGRGGSISFAITAGSGSATVDASSGLITGISPGNVTLVASSAGDSDYSPATTSQVLTILTITPILTITSADSLNVDGTLTVTVVTTAPSGRGGSISFAITAGSGSATVDASSGLITGISAGNVTLVASSAGDSDYSPATTSQVLTILATTPILTITSADSLSVDGMLTATVVTTATGGRGGSISFAITAGSGSATVDASSGLITGISVGNVTLVASSAGDSDYASATTSQALTILMKNPALTITSADSLSVDGMLTATVVTTATGGRGGAISFAITGGSGSATVDANSGLITGISAGNVTLVVSSAGDSDYSPATTSQALTILMNTPILTITSADSLSVDGTLTATVVTTATNGRGGAISFAITGGSGSATVDASSGLITGISAGNVTLVASSAGDSDYSPATTSQALTILATTPILTITSADSLSVDGMLTATVVTTATNGRGGAITFAIVGGSGSATVDANSGLITGISAGMVTLVASSAGDNDYNPATTSQDLTISMTTPILTITSSNSLNIGNTLTATVVTTATNGRGGAITFAVTAGSGSATVDSDSGLVTGISLGDVTLVASSAGDSDYNAASVSQVITISKGTPVVTITLPSGLTVGISLTATVTTTATISSGGTITFAIVGGSGSATINPVTGFIKGVHAGTVTLTASSTGDANYNAVTASQLVTVGKGSQTLIITSGNAVPVDGMLTAAATSTVSGGGAITYGITNGTTGIAFVNATTGVISAVQHGTVTLKATAAGSADYNSATTTQVVTIVQATPTLKITSANHMVVNSNLTAVVTTSATYGRGGVITYSITGGSGSATVNTSTGVIHAVSVGTVTLTARSAGDADYYSTTVSQLITISSSMLMTEIPAVTPTTFVPESVTSPTVDAADQIVVPKAFSPNGDGLDDLFEIQNISKYPNNELIIANRKGEAVFKAHGYNNQTVLFTGKASSGAELEDGIYYYLLTFYDNGKLNTFKGYFKLRK